MESDFFLDGKKYISSKQAGELFGYTSDYIGQLCRAKKLDGKMLGKTWFISEESLLEHQNKKRERRKKSRHVEIVRRDEKGESYAEIWGDDADFSRGGLPEKDIRHEEEKRDIDIWEHALFSSSDIGASGEKIIQRVTSVASEETVSLPSRVPVSTIDDTKRYHRDAEPTAAYYSHATLREAPDRRDAERAPSRPRRHVSSFFISAARIFSPRFAFQFAIFVLIVSAIGATALRANITFTYDRSASYAAASDARNALSEFFVSLAGFGDSVASRASMFGESVAVKTGERIGAILRATEDSFAAKEVYDGMEDIPAHSRADSAKTLDFRAISALSQTISVAPSQFLKALADDTERLVRDSIKGMASFASSQARQYETVLRAGIAAITDDPVRLVVGYTGTNYYLSAIPDAVQKKNLGAVAERVREAYRDLSAPSLPSLGHLLSSGAEAKNIAVRTFADGLERLFIGQASTHYYLSFLRFAIEEKSIGISFEEVREVPYRAYRAFLSLQLPVAELGTGVKYVAVETYHGVNAVGAFLEAGYRLLFEEKGETGIATAPPAPSEEKETGLDARVSILAQELNRLKTQGAQVTLAPLPPTVIERTIERVSPGISEAILNDKLNVLENELRKEIFRVQGATNSTVQSNARAIALTNIIDRLANVKITNATVDGVSGLTDADIPNDIVAANYLPLAGGTLTGALTGTNGVFSGTLGIGTTTPSEDFAVANRIYVGGTGTSTIQNNLNVLGSIAIGNVCINCGGTSGFSGGGISASATSTFSAPLIATYVPPNAHTFASWSTGVSGSNVTSASVVINPASASADTNLLGIAVNGGARFLVDAEGDVFANSLTSTGGETLSTTTISTLTVENSSTFGDATTTDRTYFNSRIGTSLIPTANNSLDIGDVTNGLAWRRGIFGTAVGVGTTSPSWPLAVSGTGSFDDFVRASYFIATSTTATSTFSGGLTVETNGFVYDFSTNNVGIGIAAPTSKLHVSGTGRFTDSVTLESTLSASGLASFSQASSTRLSVFDTLYVGRTSTTTIRGDGVASSLPYASSTALTVSGTGYFGTASTTNLTISSIPSAVPYTSAAGVVSGASLAASSVFVTDSSSVPSWTTTLPALTLGGTITGNNQSILGVNGLTATYASTTRLSVFDTLYIGGTATTTIQGSTTGTSTIQGFLNVAGTNSTSTFSGGIQATYLNITGTVATSTFANGISLSSGCFRLPNGSCAGSGGGTSIGGTVTGGTSGSVLFVDSSGNLAQNNANFFWDNTNARLGIGTTSPYQKLAVTGNIVFDAFIGTSTTATSTLAGGLALETSGLVYDFSTNNVGVGIADPDRRLEVFNTVSAAQMKISYDATTYADLQVDSTGDLIVDPSGNDMRLNDDNLWVCAGGACPTGSPVGTGNLIVETALGIASSTPWTGYELAVAGDAIITATTTLGNNFRFAPITGTTTELGIYNSSGSLILILDEWQ